MPLGLTMTLHVSYSVTNLLLSQTIALECLAFEDGTGSP